MKEVVIEGVTQKGKNRVREHGSLWNVISVKTAEGDCLLESKETGYLKWLLPDFKIVE